MAYLNKFAVNLIHAVTIVIIICTLVISGCDLLSIESIDSNGYWLYVGNYGYDEVFVVDAESNEVDHVLRGFGSLYSMATTLSGRKLYVGSDDNNGELGPANLFACNTMTRRCNLALNMASRPITAPSGDVFIFAEDPSFPGSAIGRIDTLTDRITFFDTLAVELSGTNSQRVGFHPHLPIFYTTTIESQLIGYDYERKEIMRSYRGGIAPFGLVVSRDGQALFQSGGPVLDLQTGETTGVVRGNPLGSLALSIGGDSLLVTDPGKYLIPEPQPSGKVSIYDSRDLRWIDGIAMPRDEGMGSPITDQIVLAPDGKTAYVSDFLSKVFVVDLSSGDVTDVIQPRATSINIVALAMAPKP